MFVNPIERPNSMEYLPDYGIQKYPQECYLQDKENYKEAEKNVIFKGFESVINHDWLIEKDDIQLSFNKSSIYYSELQSLGEFRCEIQTLHDLAEATKGELEINLEV